jgi:hydroxypyruvate reductase
VDGGTAARARIRGLDPAAALAATDSHPLLAATGDLVRTGPTGTNVADVVVALRDAC